MGTTLVAQGLTNHVTFVLDRSWSMSGKKDAVIQAVDTQIEALAETSRKLDQETRVTVIIFDDTVDVLVYDKDVLRLPSIKDYYVPRGRTALVDATLQAIDDLSKIPEIHSDHAFLTMVVTDGMENASTNLPSTLSRRVSKLADNWTVAAFVPDAQGEQYAQSCGFPPGNIMLWDASSVAGFEKAAATMRQATETFMAGRASGIRGSKAVFSTGSEAINRDTIKAAGLAPLDPSKYQLVPVSREVAIRDWVVECGHSFRTGANFYQLNKRETIQGAKGVAILEKKTDRVYVGDAARDLLGLGWDTVRVAPDHNADFDIFVQSTSVNRKLIPGTRLLIMV